MASYRLFLDKRNKKDGLGTLSFQIYHSGKTSTISTGIKLNDNEFDGKKVVKNPKHKIYNDILRSRVTAMDAVVASVPAKSKSIDVAEIKKRYLTQIGEYENPKNTFKSMMDLHILKIKKQTSKSYESMYSQLKKFCPRIEIMDICDIDNAFCSKFREHLIKSVNVNSASLWYGIFFTILREAYNENIIETLPRCVKIKTEETRKRNLTLEQVRFLYNLKPTFSSTYIYIDMFMLTIFLCGINPIDILNAKKTDVVNGRLEIRRSKTRKLLSINIPEEAWEIIKRYPSKKGLLVGFCDKNNDYIYFNRKVNNGLKHIDSHIEDKRKRGKIPKDITLYWARHTFATLCAKHIKSDNYVIGHALGHTWTFSKITETYIDFDMDRVDDMQKKLIALIKNKG